MATFSSDLLRILDLMAVLVAAILGGLVARQRRFDAVGFVVLAVSAALGGGIIRDVMLQAGRPIAIEDPYYLPMALTGALIAFIWRMGGKWTNRMLIVTDAFVLGAWSAIGCTKALNLGLGIVPSVLMGVTTAIGGGMIRDVLVGQVPQVFGGNTLYATAAFLATVPAIILWHLGYPNTGTILATIVGAMVCIGARWYKWRLPAHTDWTITLTRSQMAALVRRAERTGRRKERSRSRGRSHGRRRTHSEELPAADSADSADSADGAAPAGDGAAPAGDGAAGGEATSTP